MSFTVCADSTTTFTELCERLIYPEGAKKKLVFRCSGWRWSYIHEISSILLPVFQAANGLRHIRITGGFPDGEFHAWTGDSSTSASDAEVSFTLSWREKPEDAKPNEVTVPMTLYSSPIFNLTILFDLLHASLTLRLVIEISLKDARLLPKSHWWSRLSKLPAVEELESHFDVVKLFFVHCMAGKWRSRCLAGFTEGAHSTSWPHSGAWRGGSN
jgi:hypothetical protein